MRISTINLVMASTFTLTLGGAAHAAVWIGGSGNEYSTPANWDDGLAPTGGSTQNIDTAVTVERVVDSTAGRTFVSGGATLNVTGGTHNDSQTGNSTRNFIGQGSAGTVNQSGGSYSIGHSLVIGGAAGGNGVYNLTAGDLIIFRGANAANLGGSYSLELGDNGEGSGLFEISGGSFETRINVGIGETGVFSIVGSGASSIGIGSNGSLDGAWTQFAGGTLRVSMDGGGVTKVFVDDIDGGGVSIDFQAGSLVDIVGTAAAGTYVLLEAEATTFDASTIAGLSLSGATDSGWSLGFDNVGGNGQVTATYVVPEPGSLALIGLGGLAILRRRR